jgi:hypothetical protein
VLADFVDGTDIGMIQGGGSAGFAAKAFERLRVGSGGLRKKLDGNEAAELSVFGFVDLTHPAAAQHLDDAIVRDDLADHCAEMLGPGVGQVNEGRGGVMSSCLCN